MTDNSCVAIVGDKCCGCGACVAACPKSCLDMKADDLGFLYPQYIGECVNCGKCVEVCPRLKERDKDEVVLAQWAAARDAELLGKSSSGGVFGLLARRTLAGKGAVYGACYAEGCHAVKHVRVERIEELDSILRSKYVQSSVGVDVYRMLTEDLLSGVHVLFSGVSCQCAAVLNYLRVEEVPVENLLVVDVVCHGVPAPRLWRSWLDFVSQEAGSQVDEVNFRCKASGWPAFSVAYYAQGQNVRGAKYADDWYYRTLLNGASLRESCYACMAKRSCGSDITLADFWGVKKFHPEAGKIPGVSAAICNTRKGADAIADLDGLLEHGTASIDEMVSYNPSMVQSAQPFSERDAFLADVSSGMDISCLSGKWRFEPSFGQKIRSGLSFVKHDVFGL